MLTSLEIPLLQKAYERNDLSPSILVAELLQRIDDYKERDSAVWIALAERQQLLDRAHYLEAIEDRTQLPLYGIPFAVKDNIDCVAFETTAGCPQYAYQPQSDAFVVRRLLDAGAILMGKTNLDQFATGLVGTRSPYGAPRSVFDRDYISGGSSSGSAVAVAAGLVSFALGTDTAGSGRVPAAFNNLVGVKPSRGLVSTSGVVPACRSLDCVTVFATSCGEADMIRRIMQGRDLSDPFSRELAPQPLTQEGFSFGVPVAAQREFFGDKEAESLYEQSICRLEALGGQAVEFDYEPFRHSAELLYSGPWVAERTAAIGEFATANPEAVDATVGKIILAGKSSSAVEAFRGLYRLEELKTVCDQVWNQVDFLLLPTTPTTYRVEEVAEKPIELNSRLGYYTNFVNLLDCCAVAVPAGFRAGNGLPFGVTLIAPAFCDDSLAVIADRLHRAGVAMLQAGDRGESLAEQPSLAPADSDDLVELAVVGAHLSGQPLNYQLTSRGGKLLETTTTAGAYRLYALAGSVPPKPGLIQIPGYAGEGLEVEIWVLNQAAFGAFTDEVPSPLGIGTLLLRDGRSVKGFICEGWAVEGAEDITAFGGWRNYRASLED